MKRFKDLQYGSTIWKLYTTKRGTIRLNKLIVISATPIIGEDSYKLVVLLSNGDYITVTRESSQGCSIQLEFGYSIYCDKIALIQRIEEEEDLVISQLITSNGDWCKYNSIEQMFSEIYEKI